MSNQFERLIRGGVAANSKIRTSCRLVKCANIAIGILVFTGRSVQMKYRKLGNTGLIVSSVALGTMQFGGKMNMGNLGQEDTTRMVKLALDRGINFIDTADVYSLGESETLVGNALKGIRDEIVLATKVRLPMSDNFNHGGAP